MNWKHLAFVAALSVSALAFGKEPATKPVKPASPTTRPAVKPLPTPGELLKQIKAREAEHAKLLQVAMFDFTRGISEKPPEFDLFGRGEMFTLRTTLERLAAAKEDKDLKAVVLYMGTGTSLNLAQAAEVRESLADLRRAGKKTFAYADAYDTVSYAIASACTNVCLLEGGEIMIPGVGFETMFYKGTFDKLGVKADYVQIGEYKGAEEPYTRTEPSEELKGEMNKLVDSYYRQIVATISDQRSLSSEEVKHLVDDAMISGKVAAKSGLVDHLTDPDGLRDLIRHELGDDIDVNHHYGEPDREKLDFSNPFALLAQMTKEPEPDTRPGVAVVYAEGVISDGESQSSMLGGGGGIGSEDIRKAMRIAGRDDNIKAVVIRIDSPGGSALASEAMWQAVRRVSKNKPVIISIGGMAASGGYYLASAGDYVVADPTAIVGSIGVVGGKFVLNDLYEKLGLSTMNFSRGENANLFSSTSTFDERQKRQVRTMMKNTYDQFIERVTSGRGHKIKDIDKVARGRIFLAADAKELGMVDEIGGLRRAIAIAADRAKLPANDYAVQTVPPVTTLGDMLTGRSEADAASIVRPMVQVKDDSIMRLLPRNVREQLVKQIQFMELLEQRPVVLMSPFSLQTR